MSAFYTNYGYHPELAIRKGKGKGEEVPIATERAELIGKIQEEVREMLALAQRKQAQAYNRNHRSAPLFEVGDKVWLSKHFITTK